MENIEDGEYKPEKELEKNFKIPKRKSEEITKELTATPDDLSPSDYQTVLSNSYYNYNSNVSMGQWPQGNSCYSNYPQNYNNDNSSVTVAEPIAQQIYSTLENYKEKPKNLKKDIFKETVPDCDDPTLPKELILLFQPLYCKLCACQLSSNIMAKLHYKSKNHEKKIRKFLIEHSEKTGEPLHKRAKLLPVKKASEDDTDPRFFHCNICDLALTGKLHAESHYMGRNHQKALMGYKSPAGSGYYDANGKWVRLPNNSKKPTEGEDTFGTTFRTANVEKPPEELPASTSAVSHSKFHCDICKISATCQQQLEMHFKGHKHQKKLKHLGLPADPEPINNTEGTEDPLTNVANAEKVDKNSLSVYRTPSGKYYCQICNLTLNSEAQFKTHLGSKNHFKKASHQLQQK